MTVHRKLRSNEPLYIEDFWRSGPDSHNGQNANGDGNDWLPAFNRAARHHLTTAAGANNPLHRTYQRRIFVGRDEQTYRLSGTLRLFGLWLEGLTDVTELFFDQGTDGIRIDSPTAGNDTGTSNDVPAPYTGFGGYATIKNLIINGEEAPGTRGLIIHRTALIEDVTVMNWGWHGFHLTADVTRTWDPAAFDDPGSSNANKSTFTRCIAQRVGFFPGTHTSWVTPTNPTGQRPYGSGLRIQGGDGNVCLTTQFNGRECARFAIFDSGFLGNVHHIPHCVTCRHTVTQLELDIFNGVLGTPVPGPERDREILEFDTYGQGVGEMAQFAYAATNPNSRGKLDNPYVEGASVTPIVDTRSPNWVAGGIGGAETATTKRFNPNRSIGEFWWEHTDAQSNAVRTALNSGFGVVLNVTPPDGQPLRLKYNSFPGNTPTAPGSDDLGYFRCDVANSNAQKPFLITGQNAQTVDGRSVPAGTLAAGRMVFPFGYYVTQSRLPVAYGTRAALPDLSDEQTADTYPVGSEYIVSDPLIDDTSDRYRCVADGGAPHGRSWRAF